MSGGLINKTGLSLTTTIHVYVRRSSADEHLRTTPMKQDFIYISLIHLVSESTLDGVTDRASRHVAPLSPAAAAADGR